MKDPKIEEELKKRRCPTFSVIKDPETGVERLEEDKAAISFSYDSVELEKWIKEEAIPKDLSEFIVKESEEIAIRLKESKEMVARVRKEGREPTSEDWLELIKTKQQTMEHLLKGVEFHKFILENRESLLKTLQKPSPKNKTFRQSRELIDNKLDRDIDKEKLSDPESTGAPIIRGLDLDQAEDRILHTLTLLLSKKSENKDQTSSEYYMGNYEKGIVRITEIEMETARILVSPHEFYSTYYGRENYNSDHIKFVLKKLHGLLQKQYLTTWNFRIKGTVKKYNKFRTYCPLFNIVILNSDLSENECQDIDNNKELLEGKGCQFLFKFQPQFTNNIRDRYVEFPEDIYQRITEAIGKDRFSQSINLMRDFLFREKQSKRYDIIRDKDTLIGILKLDKFWEEGRKKKVEELIVECLEVFLKIGLLEEWKAVKGKADQDQYQIKINKDFK